MGAEQFIQTGHGETPQKAFKNAYDEACYEYGNRGYTGSMAEKDSFIVIDLPQEMSAYEYADKLMDDDDERISDKWGDAGCIKVKDGEYVFFGWASS